MPQPLAVDDAARRLIALFESAQDDIQRQLLFFTDGRRAARLRELGRTVLTLLDGLRTSAREWLQSELPSIYQLGGASAAETLGEAFVWSQPHIGAVQQLASRSFNDLLEATSFVERDTKQWIRDEARQQVTLSLLEGRTTQQAATALGNAAGSELGLFTVRYKDGSLHALDDYADSAIRAVSAETYNAGTINQSRAMGVQFAEVADGAECGLRNHTDNEKPNGRIYLLDVIEQYPISHPRCRRSILPRIDATSTDAVSLRPDAQRADQAASELSRTRRSPRTTREARVANTIRRQGLKGTTADAIVKRGGSAIDKVHELPGGLRRIPVSLDPNLKPSTQAVFTHTLTAPVNIRINPDSTKAELAYLHEYGHYLDFEAIAGPGAFASESLTDDGALLHDWWQAVDQSALVHGLRTNGALNATQELSEYRDYLLGPTELFARSYAQWIARESGDSVLVSQLDEQLARNLVVQWSTDDFEPISDALSGLFRTLGLLK